MQYMAIQWFSAHQALPGGGICPHGLIPGPGKELYLLLLHGGYLARRHRIYKQLQAA